MLLATCPASHERHRRCSVADSHRQELAHVADADHLPVVGVRVQSELVHDEHARRTDGAADAQCRLQAEAALGAVVRILVAHLRAVGVVALTTRVLLHVVLQRLHAYVVHRAGAEDKGPNAAARCRARRVLERDQEVLGVLAILVAFDFIVADTAAARHLRMVCTPRGSSFCSPSLWLRGAGQSDQTPSCWKKKETKPAVRKKCPFLQAPAAAE